MLTNKIFKLPKIQPKQEYFNVSVKAMVQRKRQIVEMKIKVNRRSTVAGLKKKIGFFLKLQSDEVIDIFMHNRILAEEDGSTRMEQLLSPSKPMQFHVMTKGKIRHAKETQKQIPKISIGNTKIGKSQTSKKLPKFSKILSNALLETSQKFSKISELLAKKEKSALDYVLLRGLYLQNLKTCRTLIPVLETFTHLDFTGEPAKNFI